VKRFRNYELEIKNSGSFLLFLLFLFLLLLPGSRKYIQVIYMAVRKEKFVKLTATFSLLQAKTILLFKNLKFHFEWVYMVRRRQTVVLVVKFRF